MLDQLRDLARSRLEQRTIPVPQTAVNFTLPHLLRDINELQSLQVDVYDGHFDVHAQVKKFVEVEAELRFEIKEVALSSECQVITVQRIGATRLSGADLTSRIVVLVVESVFLALLKKDPASYAFQTQQGVTVDGDYYTVDLGEMGLFDRLKKSPSFNRLLLYGRIVDIECRKGTFALKPKLDADNFGQSVQSLLGGFLNND